jgi:hypothetical protein
MLFFKFDRKVRDAPAGIEDERLKQCSGGTGSKACVTAFALIELWLIQFKLDLVINSARKIQEPRS